VFGCCCRGGGGGGGGEKQLENQPGLFDLGDTFKP